MQNAEITPPRSLDLFVDRRLVAVRAELLEFNPFSGVAAVLLAGVTRHARGPLGGVGPAFRALESDHDPDALVLSHIRTLRRLCDAIGQWTTIPCRLTWPGVLPL